MLVTAYSAKTWGNFRKYLFGIRIFFWLCEWVFVCGYFSIAFFLLLSFTCYVCYRLFHFSGVSVNFFLSARLSWPQTKSFQLAGWMSKRAQNDINVTIFVIGKSINFIYFQQTIFFSLSFSSSDRKKNQYWVKQNECAESSCMATKLWTVCVCVERRNKKW